MRKRIVLSVRPQDYLIVFILAKTIPGTLYYFSSTENGFISFLRLLANTNQTVLLDAFLKLLIIC